jgi:hypothetical protein
MSLKGYEREIAAPTPVCHLFFSCVLLRRGRISAEADVYDGRRHIYASLSVYTSFALVTTSDVQGHKLPTP